MLCLVEVPRLGEWCAPAAIHELGVAQRPGTAHPCLGDCDATHSHPDFEIVGQSPHFEFGKAHRWSGWPRVPMLLRQKASNTRQRIDIGGWVSGKAKHTGEGDQQTNTYR